MTDFYIQRRVYLLVVSALVIAVSVGVPYKVAAYEETLQSDDLSLPNKKGAWMVEVQEAGGMIYRMDEAAINSDGQIIVRVDRRSGGGSRINCSCSSKITDEDLAKLQHVVSSAKPSAWLDHYEKGRVYDAPSSSIRLTSRADDSTEHSYHSSWVSVGGAAALRPSDLIELDGLVWQIREKMKGQCQFKTD